MSEEHLISLYIDDEMDMDQKISFVETVHQNRPYTDTALALLRQEKLLRADLTVPAFQPESRMILAAPPSLAPSFLTRFLAWCKPLAGAPGTVGAAVAAALALGLFFLYQPDTPLAPLAPVQQPGLVQHSAVATPAAPLGHQQRFVLYLPGSKQARIVGTFTNWKPLAMERIGESGYWALTLPVPPGEHRYSYLIEENKRIADPTVIAREQDDFGGENSIIEVQTEI